jgi:hypothetical protein
VKRLFVLVDWTSRERWMLPFQHRRGFWYSRITPRQKPRFSLNKLPTRIFFLYSALRTMYMQIIDLTPLCVSQFFECIVDNFSRFRVCKIYLLRCLSSFLGAGLGKRTQKTLGAHLLRFGDRSERKCCCFVLQTKLRFLYWKFDIVRSLYINALFHHSHRITPINV